MKIIGYGLIGIVGFCVLAVMAGMDGALDGMEPGMTQSDKIAHEKEMKALDLQIQEVKEELVDREIKGHAQYVRYLEGKVGNRSSYFPHVGAMKGDDFRNCIGKKYYVSADTTFDKIHFCGWHAEIGDHRYIDGDRYSIWQNKNKVN